MSFDVKCKQIYIYVKSYAHYPNEIMRKLYEKSLTFCF